MSVALKCCRGLVSVGGGKLSAFRAMVEHTVDEISPSSGSRESREMSRAARLPEVPSDEPRSTGTAP